MELKTTSPHIKNDGNNTREYTFDYFTGGKTPEFAIFYNVACDNLENYIQSLSDSTIEKPLENPDLLNEKILTYLRQYLWKGNLDNKNDSGQPITADEKDIIRQLILKVIGIRNFQSHIWHDNEVFEFNKILKEFIEERHDNALRQLEKEPGNDSTLYLENLGKYPLFFWDKIKGKNLITQDGRAFLLSLFLNKGNMSAFLQQRIGSKRNDMPEYQFKHKLYMYYCHRDGSAWASTGIKNEVLEKADEQEKQRILMGRQSFKIINYLNDKPEYFNHQDSIPLYYTNNNGNVVEVTGMPSLKEYLNINNLLIGIVIRIRRWDNTLPEDATWDKKKENDRQKMMELKRREGVGYLKLKENNKYEFEITFCTLKHIVTDVLLNRSFTIESATDDGIETKVVTAEAHFYGVLKDAIDSRQYIYKTLSEVSSDASISFENFKIKKLFNSVYVDYSQSVDIIDKVFYTKDQLRHLPISPTPKLEELLIEWHYSFTNNKENELKKRKRLLNYIRPIDSIFDESPYIKNNLKKIPANTEPQPLLFHLSYYYKEQTQKLRSEDRFLEWGIRYLLDFNLIPNCYVEVEQYVFEKKPDEPESKYKLKQELQYVQQLPENYRLRIRDNQVNVAVKNTNPNSNKPEYYKFRMGEKVMKYLLYALFDKKRNQQKTVDDFMIAVSNDYAKFFTKDEQLSENSFNLLESFSIPAFLYKVSLFNDGVKINHQPLRLELTVGLDKKIKWIENQLELRTTYNRNQKNEAILKAYTFFDFSKVKHKKFLRKNEYEQMSICHYMLNQNKDKVISLLSKTFKIKERLPEEIYSIIKAVIDGKWEEPLLDILFAKVFEDRRGFLMSLKEMVTDNDLPIKLIKPQLSFLNLSVSDSNLKEANRIERQIKRKESLNFLPFSLHPALVLKYFYPDDFAAKKFDGNVPHSKGGNKYNNLFAELRKNLVLTTVLENDYYNIADFENLSSRATSLVTNEEEKLDLTKRLRILKGRIIDTHTKDVFLSLIAQRYLENYDNVLADEFAKLRGKRMINIAGLFKKEVIIPISKNTFAGKMEEYTDDEKKMIPNQLFICFRLHQADDYFFRMKKDELGQLALHFINFRNEELVYYANDADLYNKIAEWPDGTHLKPIPLGQLMQELKNITNMANRLMKYVLQYERTVIDKYIIEAQAGDSGKSKQDCITAISGGRDYLSFAEILELDKITEEVIKKAIKNLRNSCLHNKIPLKQSYSEQTLPGSAIGNALSITERIAPDRRKYLQYE